ncbi:translation initiation factor IF-2-like isoform X2 [Gallus gallus]|uniref:translation initiation factor IF-2-like isoform X2 n=1 Tax=Gallus gallus TaxID=9031 RepID=UPI001AE780A2|nr:translation initiation factor IF-2-like isoform X2 [Gallus gallus]
MLNARPEPTRSRAPRQQAPHGASDPTPAEGSGTTPHPPGSAPFPAAAPRPPGSRRVPPRYRRGGGGRHVGAARPRPEAEAAARPPRTPRTRRPRPLPRSDPRARAAAAVGASGPNPARADLCGRDAWNVSSANPALSAPSSRESPDDETVHNREEDGPVGRAPAGCGALRGDPKRRRSVAAGIARRPLPARRSRARRCALIVSLLPRPKEPSAALLRYARVKRLGNDFPGTKPLSDKPAAPRALQPSPGCSRLPLGLSGS